MGVEAERRALQIAVALACFVPLSMGGTSILSSLAVIQGMAPPWPADLDSHYRYLSGILFGIGLVFAASIPRIECAGTIFRTLCAIIVVGGLARLVSLGDVGWPSAGHRFGLVMELGVVPTLTLWQARIARLWPKADKSGARTS